MAREWKEVPDETDEIVLEDTQEYRVAGFDEPGEESPEADDTREYEERVADEDFDDREAEGDFPETREYEEDVEYEDEEEFDDREYDDEPESEEYYEDDEYFEEEEPDEPPTREEPEPLPVIGKPYEPLAERVRGIWAAIAEQARGIEKPKLKRKQGRPDEPSPSSKPVQADRADQPARPNFDSKLLLPILAILIAALAVGIGAYAIGKGSGDDVDVARLEGEAAGKQAGAIEGASRGYAEGFVKGRDEGFRKTYEEAYRLNFKRAFEQAGLDVPADKDIDVPEP